MELVGAKSVGADSVCEESVCEESVDVEAVNLESSELRVGERGVGECRASSYVRRDCPCLPLGAAVKSECARTEGTQCRAGDGQRDGAQVNPGCVSQPFLLPGLDQNYVH